MFSGAKQTFKMPIIKILRQPSVSVKFYQVQPCQYISLGPLKGQKSPDFEEKGDDGTSILEVCVCLSLLVILLVSVVLRKSVVLRLL